MIQIKSPLIYFLLLCCLTVTQANSFFDSRYYRTGAIELMKLQFKEYPNKIFDNKRLLSLADTSYIVMTLPLFKMQHAERYDSLIRLIDFTPNNMNQEVYIRLINGSVYNLSSEIDLKLKKSLYRKFPMTHDERRGEENLLLLEKYLSLYPKASLFVLYLPVMNTFWAIENGQLILLQVVSDDMSKNTKFKLEVVDGQMYYEKNILKKYGIEGVKKTIDTGVNFDGIVVGK